MAAHQNGHIEVEQLARLAMDDLPMEQEDSVLFHLATCDQCAELSRYLHELYEAVEGIAPAGMLLRIAAAVRSVLGWGPKIAGAGRALADLALGGILADPAGLGRLALSNLPPLAGGLAPVLPEMAGPGPPVKTRGRTPSRQPTPSSGTARPRGQLRVPAASPAGVEFEDSPKALVVRLTSWPVGIEPPSLAIVPRNGDPFLGIWKPVEGQWMARVEKPDAGFAIVFGGGPYSALR